ncbi:MAG: OsmC family protein [Paracoccaceae bacterium]
MKFGDDIIGKSKQAPFFKVANAPECGLDAPDLRLGDALRTRVRSFSGFQKEALISSARTGQTWRLVSDEGPYLNGHDSAPCPLAFLTTGMIASYMNEILALAKIRNITLRNLKLVQDNYYSMKGSMQKRTMAGGALPVELQVIVDCDLDDAALNQFIMDAVHASQLNGLMRGQLQSLFALSRNGVELATDKASRIMGPILADPSSEFANIQPDANNLVLMERVGITAKKAVKGGTNTDSSSLQDEQDRRLNIGAVATLRDDGLTEIVQLQYSPHGTSFRFLSEEAPKNGGKGRAPDANSYISAGIGFCFMTQFGRFVSMLGLDLPDYRIVQDTHFSLGGATGGTEKPGQADPVETHVFLETNETIETAQEMLDISEKTCFLHAFCRTDLKVKLKVKR